GIQMVHVPYKGSAPMLAALMGGQVDLGFDSIATSMPHVSAGRLKALAVSGASRSALAPDVPTVAESGIPGFNYSSFFAVVAPAATSAAIRERLSGEIVRIVDGSGTRGQFQNLGLEASPLPGTGLDEYLRKERSLWASVIETARISAD